MSAKFPIPITPFTKEEDEMLKKVFTTDMHTYVHVGKYTLTATYEEHASAVYNMPMRKDDIFVTTFPRSGNTWTQEMVWLINNNLDFETAKKVPLTDRYPLLEQCMYYSKECKRQILEGNANNPEALKVIEKMLSQTAYQALAEAKSQRFVKTHLPLSLLPPTLLDTCKAVYVARDPRDVAVSYYHFNKDTVYLGVQGSFEDYYNLLEKGLLTWCPLFEHVKEAWAQRHHPNLLFIFYEDMIKDLPGTVKRVAKFFNKEYSQQQLDQLCQHLSFDNFRKNTAVDLEEMRTIGIFDSEKKNFIRKGKSGGWRAYFDERLSARVRAWMDDQLNGTDLHLADT